MRSADTKRDEHNAKVKSTSTTWDVLSYGIAIAAADLGIGSGHSSVGDQDRARVILGVPNDHVVGWLIALGYPADRPLTPIVTPSRRPFDEVVHRGHW